MATTATRKILAGYSHIVVTENGKRTHYLRDNTTNKFLGYGIGEDSLKPGIDVFSQLVYSVANMSYIGRRALDRLRPELFTKEVIKGIYDIVLTMDPELKEIESITYLDAVIAKNPTTDIAKSRASKIESEYRSKPIQKTRTVDLEALKSEFAHLGTDVEGAISEQIKIYEAHETVNSHHAEKLAGDRGVLLPEHTLLHGLSYNLDLLKDIKKNGILAGEYYGHGDVTHGMADFWRMPKDTNLVDFIDRVSGRLNKKNGINTDIPLSKRLVTPLIGGVTIATEENQFLRFNNDGITFVVDPESAREFAGYDYFSDGEHPEVLDKLVTDKTSADSYAKGRRSAILVGIPYSCFSAIIVGTNIANDAEKLQSIIDLFGEDLMVIAGDGRVLSVPPYAQQSANIDELNAGCLRHKKELIDAIPDEAISRVESDSAMKWFFGQECIEQRLDDAESHLE